ncbi:SEC10/PgrA surface exclusion domain-containing protein [Lactobacillus xujianguonis]|uniref:SEC10/PgrA surface exclusion domain-containing protein n=1 Tax=Lactobacillus xujianguonis TaxID=2495899 RepID=A0A437SSS4_9LACO|nr:SEC10/PgrA surface exclusion domain-containing protein [Lactobacillus xujianguonis]RVU69970.1 SEC10/PgrA surface exclusion domain-containing protein [Lactobacillus xujianguonis]RVU72376.1 SEC10/PgrA surface exclusion domain-containing protein [Lactobacillus xujianguonis]
MKKTIKFATLFSAAAALTLGGVALTSNTTTNTAYAASIVLPKGKGYTKARVLKANSGRMSHSDKSKLSQSDKVMLSHFAMDLINQARHQMSKKSWTYKKGALKFADRTAKQYYSHNRSVWDSDHYIAGIKRAAKQSGLNSTVGQVYEDEAGLPVSSDFHGQTRTIAALKNQIYFNVKQMLFGGFAGSKADMSRPSSYVEWQHAGDLLGLRSAEGYDAKTKYFGMSFSGLRGDSSKISVHMMGVAKRYIQNYKKFNK